MRDRAKLGETYFRPRHDRDPLPQAMRYRGFNLGSSIHRSGLNLKGSGKTCGFVWCRYKDCITGVYSQKSPLWSACS